METIFYKILYRGEKVVYVGVTLRTLYERFKEHLRTKELNTKNHAIIEFDRIKHPEINSLEVFYEERKKVAELEQKYIKEELEKGSKLLNLSKGGEWGTQILSRLKKEEFLKEFGSYEGYQEYKKKKDIIKRWIHNWIYSRSINKAKVWIQSCWICSKSKNKTKAWISYWIFNRSKNKAKSWISYWISNRSINKAKVWISYWISNRSINKAKVWIKSWIHNKSKNKTKVWISYWICHRSINKTKAWISCWIHNKSKSKTKVWIQSCWIHNKSKNKTKSWLQNWTKNKSASKTKVWIRSWIHNRRQK